MRLALPPNPITGHVVPRPYKVYDYIMAVSGWYHARLYRLWRHSRAWLVAVAAQCFELAWLKMASLDSQYPDYPTA